jgi:hypothetical protein
MMLSNHDIPTAVAVQGSPAFTSMACCCYPSPAANACRCLVNTVCVTFTQQAAARARYSQHSWPVSSRTCAHHHGMWQLSHLQAAIVQQTATMPRSSQSLHDNQGPTSLNHVHQQQGSSKGRITGPCKPQCCKLTAMYMVSATALVPMCSAHTVGCETRAASCGTACTAMSTSLHDQNQALHGCPIPRPCNLTPTSINRPQQAHTVQAHRSPARVHGAHLEHHSA